jgi:hypothetical protein
VAAALWTAPAAAATLPGAAALEAQEARDRLADAKWCRLCHAGARYGAEAWEASAHARQTCADCHRGYHFNPHRPVQLDLAVLGPAPPLDAAGRLAAPVPVAAALGAAPAVRDRVALDACGTACHKELTEKAGPMRHGHGRGEDGEDAGAREPTCLDCHGEPHSIRAVAKLAVTERRQHVNERCVACHGDAARMGEAGLTTEPVASYEHSIHARKLHLGSARAPGCADCHGSHHTIDLKTLGVATCAECHPGAGESFVKLAAHEPLKPEVSPIGYYTQKFFAWLTFGTILLLCVHVLLDLLATVRAALRRRTGAAHREPTP